MIDDSKDAGRQEDLVPKKINENITPGEFEEFWEDLKTFIKRCHLSKMNSTLFWLDEIMRLIPTGWKLDLKEKLKAAAKGTVEDLAEVIRRKKINKKYPKYLSKIQFWNMKAEPDANISNVINKVTREYNSSSLEEVSL